MERILKENIFIILAVVLLFAVGCYAGKEAFTSIKADLESLGQKSIEKTEKSTKLNDILAKKESNVVEKKDLESGKVIYEVSQLQFSPEASFGIMFENIISNITATGVRVRSIDYNYQPADDKVLGSNAPGYNACELSFTAVGTYTQLQSFFKNLAREKYLSNLYEVYIEPYDLNKTILIAKFKVRLYTKSI